MKNKLLCEVSNCPEDTWKIAEKLVSLVNKQGIIALHGDLGAGKTCFVQGMSRALGIGIPISSPTYTLIDEYEGENPLYHIDLYRLSNSIEVLGIGLEEYLEKDGLIAIEWAERGEDLLPEDSIHVHISKDDEFKRRTIEVYTKGN
ncbi:MAG: tRNA (adenosine(37)-N6)-threonylcarbamoyltransferase complex ATPase subunit type 1 TsaE [Verrucomicrobiota bacterium]|nr:tRNA (adenosine(37)-N6)-threonylcarbamoyltransferase complex ATPase subunit type 1 TsaE [Kiritimatiellaceae bacterium]MEC7907866.1 tRNA (adenosine(37)-N6)-threonylcarbamoyltransferase complex ATPase subunit type 1 TsaE [Verrucomicrobiota bacterium]MEC8313578.1 tRNA (adenosine(37)-N6)-threonylcarbamoyltransferase complex ATPase subunit type 1 TsaE [Verrucomicrobiota bacterium]MEC8753060.1 tRNA (adenosine(37)-N6)-threonylcarbamoyltransferase complex ATPase subunit type 1 TsaE [Verrucomicrobiota|tara:strand:+ start:195 stop:632 length:438 start_codon:yes stop_codon:yes gene_type:complete